MRYQDRIKAYVKSSINISAAFLLGEKAFKEANKGLIDVDAVWNEIKSHYPVETPAEEVVLDTLADISDLEPLDEASDEIGDVEGDYPKRKKKRAKNS